MDEHYLGIDWGEKKVGLALADHETRIAFPLRICANDVTLTDALASVIADHHITHAVIGIPHHKQFVDVVHHIRSFGERIGQEHGIQVVFIDEMFSTKMAQAARKQAGQKKINADDADAACVILQHWLDQDA